MLRQILALTALFSGVPSCASAGSEARSAAPAERMRVTLRDYEAQQLFELVSESHTSRVEYYSAVRSDAARKIQTDEVVDALIDELEDRGFDDFAQAGQAPSRGNELVSRSLEIERGDKTEHWVVGRGSAADEQLRFHDCMLTFVELYNLTASYQTIENPSGGEIFPQKRSGRT